MNFFSKFSYKLKHIKYYQLFSLFKTKHCMNSLEFCYKLFTNFELSTHSSVLLIICETKSLNKTFNWIFQPFSSFYIILKVNAMIFMRKKIIYHLF